MENNVTDSGSRVTRSLRKRLTSVDSDNSSRPGTPVPTKLISMLEKTTSPSRSTRMTRRNSTSGVATPVKTPAKREAVTPARRTTRRRSVSVYENEEISQTALKTPSFAALVEESESSGQITTRVTRSQSKSPQQLIISKSFPSNKQTKSPEGNEYKEVEVKNKKADDQRRRKPGPRSKTRDREDSQDWCEVEIDVFENEDVKFKSSNITTIVLTDEESNLTAITNTEQNETQPPLPKVDAENIIENAALKTNMFENKINTKPSPSLHLTEKETTSRNDKTTNTREQKELHDLSDVKISVLGNDIEDLKYLSIVLNDEESNLMAVTNAEENKTHPANEKSPLSKLDAENVMKKDAFKPNTFENKLNTSLHLTEKQITPRNAKTTKTREKKELHDLSDVKIRVLGNDIEDLKYRSSNSPTIVLNDEESNLMALTNTEENNTQPDNEKSPLPKVDAKNVMEKDALKPNTFENKLNTNLSPPRLHLTEKQITPQNSKTTKTREQKELQDLSEDEIIILENDIEDLKYRSSNNNSNVLNDEGLTRMALTNTEENTTQPDNEKSPLPKVDVENVIAKDALKPNTFEKKLNTNQSPPCLHLTEKQITPKNSKTTKTREQKELQDLSEDEIIILENDIEDLQYRSSNNNSNVLNDERSNLMALTNTEENTTQPDNEKSPLPKVDAENSLAKAALKTNTFENKINTKLSPSLHSTEKQTTSKNDKTTNIKILKEPVSVEWDQYKSDEQLEEIDNIEKQNVNIPMEDTPEKKINDQNTSEIENTFQRKENTLKKDNITEFNTVANDINSFHVEKYATAENKETPSNKIEIISCCSLTPYFGDNRESNVSDCKSSSKQVDFVSSLSNDMTIKTVYPKTPGSTKTSNNFFDDNSFQKDGSFQAGDNLDSLKDEINDKEVGEKELKIIGSKLTPTHSLKSSSHSLEMVQSSTPFGIESSSNEKDTLENKDRLPAQVPPNKLENSLKENVKDDHKTIFSEINVVELKKWVNPSVKGTSADGSKLDVIIANSIDCCNYTDSVEIHTNKKKSIIFSSEDENEEDVDKIKRVLVEDEDDDGEAELEPGEKPYKRKHDFHDDEAMEVNDYESGDSMDSEERREIEENELRIEGESIGSYTTDDDHSEHVEEEDSENVDSFIISDTEEVECLESYDDDEHIDEDISEHKRKKKVYKRLKRPTESSSSSDEEKENLKSDNNVKNSDEKQESLNASLNSDLEEEKRENEFTTKTNRMEMKLESNSCDFITDTNKSNKYILDSSKLSDSALRLQCTAESESDEGVNAEKTNISRKEILRKLNQSDRFNKSVRDLNPEIDTSPVENFETCLISKQDAKVCGDKNNAEESFQVEQTSNSFTGLAKKSNNGKKIQSESHLGEVSVTSESDADKENGSKSLFLPNRRKTYSGLSASFSSYKKKKEKQEWQRSFKIGVTVKSGEIETNITDVQSKETESTTLSSTEDQENGELGSEDIRYLENIRHIPLPLGNPLIRTRRQSLALPTNPDIKICSSSHGVASIKKPHRISLGVLSSGDFNPSQSFVDSIELQKTEHNRHVAKRKRLSKSFCGASETLDNSVVDIDVRHLHKRSRLISENSIDESQLDSIENINSSKLFTKISSTPHEKINKNDSSKNMQRILSRCEEILEAANRKKLEAKNNKKSKFKISSKRLKKKSSAISSDERDCALKSISKDLKRKDKTKRAISQAIKAADVILGKKKKIQQCMNEKDDLQCSGSNVLEATEEYVPIKKCLKEISVGQEKTRKHETTSAGKFMEFPQSPERKKKTPTYIHLSTGIVSVEPVTPKKRSVQALNGSEFRESPITPAGFKVRRIAPVEKIQSSSSTAAINRKRKRNHDKTIKHCSLPKSQWTQSGIFIEEVISKNRPIAQAEVMHSVCQGSQKSRKHLVEREHYANLNFKEIALMRPDIKRSTKRDILLLKERRQVQGYQ